MFKKNNSTISFLHLISLLAILLLSACGNPDPALNAGHITVLATTSIVADVVNQIAGGAVQVDTLIPAGSDPHAFEPAPQDMAKAASAAAIFANGAGLEEFLSNFLENADAADRVVDLSEAIPLLDFNSTGDEHENDVNESHNGDPHVWTDPNNILLWVDKIESTLSALDPSHSATFAANADTYRQQLRELDAWIRSQVSLIPPEDRLLVTDHQVFGYFAAQYGFKQIGAILPAYSTLSMPTAQELAQLEDAMRSAGVQVILVGETVNPNLAERVAEDTGVQLVYIYTGSLSSADGPAATYLDYMRHNVSQMITALQGCDC